MKVLHTGIKEYPPNSCDDDRPGGGMESYAYGLLPTLSKRVEVTLVTRKCGRTKKEPFKTVRVPWVRGKALRNLSYNFTAFIASLREDYDLLHAHGLVASFFALTASKLRGKPVVCTPHGLATGQPQYGGFYGAVLGALEKFTYKRVPSIFLSEEEKDSFKKKLGFLPRESFILYPGVDVNRFKCTAARRKKAREALGIKKEFAYCFVGRLEKVKAVENLVRAMPRGAVLLVAGSGPEEARLRKAARKKDVRFLGRVNEPEKVLWASDCFVLPSLSEGLPLAWLEAMAAGLPCVVTDVGLPVKKGEAVVVKKGSVSSLRAGLFEARRRKKPLSRASVKKAKNYSWNKNARELERIYSFLVPHAE
jgi:glycosyltransferase involved in cell wall biosynthesis